MFADDISADIDDDLVSSVHMLLRERTAQGLATTASIASARLRCSLDEAEHALAFLLRSSLPLISMNLQRGFAGRWVEAYQALLPGQACFIHTEQQALENLNRSRARVNAQFDRLAALLESRGRGGV